MIAPLVAALLAAGNLTSALPQPPTMVAQTVSDPETHTRAVGDAAIEQWRRSLVTGDWKPFLAMLTPGANIWYPGSAADVSRFMGETGPRYIHSAERAAGYFAKLSAAYANTLRVADVIARSSTRYTAVYELRVEGTRSDGTAYLDRMALSLDVCGDKICAYRQYYGADGKSS